MTFTDESAMFDADGLIGGHCESCDRRHFPHARWCPWCGEEATTRCRLATRGVLWAWTAVTAPPPGYDGPVPYGFGVVTLDDGLQVVTRLTEADPSRLTEGQSMEFRVDALSAEVTTWSFSPAPSRPTVSQAKRS